MNFEVYIIDKMNHSWLYSRSEDMESARGNRSRLIDAIDHGKELFEGGGPERISVPVYQDNNPKPDYRFFLSTLFIKQIVIWQNSK